MARWVIRNGKGRDGAAILSQGTEKKNAEGEERVDYKRRQPLQKQGLLYGYPAEN